MIGEAIETDRREDELYGEKRGDERFCPVSCV
jgi:hypothetical protein